ncbi:hypothetical protein [Chryseobacterium sp. ERMR1:04]|uniref:hypothetical protein n=1 Tax=Chryseobacterium sp. ERMR1:04 TaxID=1705393 RepID=UPI0006C851F6|nr:hypothetical protein [Chryseobacterium sp. ERMR1:04]KPH11600.1 hypothetical protein AMQ68_19610 [Chryseobacterium sp. ERMR1:04]
MRKVPPFFIYPLFGAHAGGIIQFSVAQGFAGHLVPGHIAGTLIPGIGQFTFPPCMDFNPLLESFFKFFIMILF